MVDIYIDLIRSGNLTIDKVPLRWRAAVEEALNPSVSDNKEEK